MSDRGFYCVDRSIWDHPLFDDGAYSKREAWLWMISEAVWKPREKMVAGRIVPLNRGQFSHSIRFMADVWGWPKSVVLRFIRRLEKAQMVFSTRSETASVHGTGQCIITICNYDKYQNQASENGTGSGTAAGQQGDKLNTLKKETKEREDAPAKRRVLAPLSDDWKPAGELTLAQAAELEKMRDWAKSNATRKADWEATFRNWLRRAGVPPVKTGEVVPIKGFFVLDDSRERAAWEAWGIRNGKAFPRGMKSGGWAFPSQWPPGYEETNADNLGRSTEAESNSEGSVGAGALGQYLRSAVQSNVLRIGRKGSIGA